MLTLFGLALLLLGVCVLLLIPFLVGMGFYQKFRGSRAVTCPENHQQVAVAFDAMHAALTQLGGRPHLRLAECTRWPERADCDQGCIPQAQTIPGASEQAEATAGKRIYHLPVLVAAVLAWVFGAIWHSQYLFRAQWSESLGLTRYEVHEMGWHLVPHLLTFGVPLLFAYGVAWLLSLAKRRGILLGMGVALGLWAAVAAAGFAGSGLAGLPADLLKIELGYTFLASAIIGATIGGLSGRLVERTWAKNVEAHGH
jgi:hypothetical protein